MQSKIIENYDNLLVFGLSGYATCGKDTFAEIMIRLLSYKNIQGARFNLADDLKNWANSITIPAFNIDTKRCSAEIKEKIRPLLVGIGNSFRNVDPDFWINVVSSKARHLIYTNLHRGNFLTAIIIPDVRNFNEATWIKSHKNGYVISLTREGIEAPNQDEASKIPLIASQYADLCVSLPNIESTENILTSAKLVATVQETLETIWIKRQNSATLKPSQTSFS